MKKFLLVLILIILSVAIGLNWNRNQSESILKDDSVRKTVLLRFALVSDSANENELLAKALSQAQGAGVNFVIGLGDWSSVGTIEQLTATKAVFDKSGLTYYLTAGDHDLWDSRNRSEEATANFRQIFGEPTKVLDKEGIRFVIVDNSDIYSGIDTESWKTLNAALSSGVVNVDKNGESSKFEVRSSKLTFVFAHKTPFHPQSAHVMGEQSAQVARQTKEFLSILENNNVDGFFSGDLHFFAQFNSPKGNVKMTTVGAVNSARNFQGPRFAVVTVFDDYSWEVS